MSDKADRKGLKNLEYAVKMAEEAFDPSKAPMRLRRAETVRAAVAPRACPLLLTAICRAGASQSD